MTYMMTRNNDLNELFDGMFHGWDFGCGTHRAVNVSEDGKAYYLEAALPGYESKDVKLHIDNHVLHLSAAGKAAKDDRKYLVRERFVSDFDSSFSLPEGVDEEAVEADFRNGLLTVTLPKLSVEKPRQIQVKVSA
ncbi:MAG: Hsp20/alpha crystallin family protein [Sphaerochaeta sp.]